MTTEHLSSLAADPSLFTPSCLNVSIAATFIWLYPSFQAGQGRAGQGRTDTENQQTLSRCSGVLAASAPVLWQHQLQFYGFPVLYLSNEPPCLSSHLTSLVCCCAPFTPSFWPRERVVCSCETSHSPSMMQFERAAWGQHCSRSSSLLPTPCEELS